MSLPFNNEDKEKKVRKWQCFVCGVLYEDFDQFRQHIIDTHEEGREYIICPLERCKAPVRDIRMHFKAKHPYDQLPKKGMMRAIVWKDISTKGGKPKTKKVNFKEGSYTSSKMKMDFKYRSGYEETVYECLDSWHEILAFEPEPFEVSYIFEGKAHKYIPDIIVTFIDGHKEVWEIKPVSQTDLPKNKAKWDYARDFCKARGWKFEVVTEVVINKLKHAVKTQHLKS